MLTRDFYFDLPEELIAQHPSPERGKSRLLVIDAPDQTEALKLEHSRIDDICRYIPKNAVMVVNNSKVRRARIKATSRNGGLVEVLLLHKISDLEWECMLSKNKRRKPDEILTLDGGIQIRLCERLPDGTWRAESRKIIDTEYLENFGHIPLPPYIRRMEEEMDAERYQTVFAAAEGSVAAPTAGLHFTAELLDAIRKRGVDIVEITLHVGLGTFLPVRSESILDHKMHSEEYSISKDSADRINLALKEKRPVLAVGTTSMRTLESSCRNGVIQAGNQSTDIFIYPGYQFKAVNMLLTNFHTPESTLLMLVSAFADKETIFSAYREAVEQRYRFFSYGDAMLINRYSSP
ncbi:tRNA preQ1(34) S-adenosylmethionine ribosyltransferase-isomerase QueA [Spirochaeta dissipatitropha]